MFGYKKLNKRLQSLEDELGLIYTEGTFSGHTQTVYGYIHKLEEEISKLKSKTEVDNDNKTGRIVKG